MDTAKGALQKIRGEFRDVDKLHDIMDDIQEQQGLANEICEAISNPVGFQDVDEDEMNEQGELDGKLLVVSKRLADNLPTPPSAIPVNQITVESPRRKKLCQKQLEQVDGTLQAILNRREELKRARMQVDISEILERAAVALDNVQSIIDIGKLKYLRAYMKRQKQKGDKIEELLCPIDSDSDEEEELLKELDEMQKARKSNEASAGASGIQPTPASTDELISELQELHYARVSNAASAGASRVQPPSPATRKLNKKRRVL